MLVQHIGHLEKKMLGALNDYNLSRKFYGGWRLGSPTLKQM